MLRQASRASPLRLVLLWSFCILHRVVPLTPKAIESVSLLEFWNLIADETQSVVLGVQIPGDDNGTLPRVAAAFAEYDRRRFRTDNTSHRESVLFRVTTQQLPFVNGPAVLVFTKQPTDYSCLVKPDVRTYPKQLEEYVGGFMDSFLCLGNLGHALTLFSASSLFFSGIQALFGPQLSLTTSKQWRTQLCSCWSTSVVALAGKRCILLARAT